MIGRRSCSSASSPVAAVVKIVKLSKVLPIGDCQRSQSPAKNISGSFAGVMYQGYLDRPVPTHSQQPCAGTRKCRRSSKCRNVGLVGADSARVLKVERPKGSLCAQPGTRPHRIEPAFAPRAP